MSDDLRRLAELFHRARRPVAFTGAGVSTESDAAHLALAGLHRLERLDCRITQNIDDLHQRAGLPADEVHAWLRRPIS